MLCTSKLCAEVKPLPLILKKIIANKEKNVNIKRITVQLVQKISKTLTLFVQSCFCSTFHSDHLMFRLKTDILSHNISYNIKNARGQSVNS